MSHASLAPPVASPPPRAPLRRGRARALLTLLRPYQWVKNLLVVPLPLVDPAVWPHASAVPLAVAVAVFVLASSLVYVGNDIADRERDRAHPVKRHRPIASGLVPVPLAAGLGCALAGALAALVATAAPHLAWPVGAYLALNVLYSVRLKHLPLLDLFTVVLGFELRIVAGYAALGAAVSTWLLLCGFFLCLVLLLGKRRRELAVSGSAHRPALAGYSTALIDQLLTVSATLAAVVFVFFLTQGPAAAAATDPTVLLLIPPAMLGLFRYLQILSVEGAGGDPVRTLLGDRLILGTAGLCALVVVVSAVLGGFSAGGWPW